MKAIFIATVLLFLGGCLATWKTPVLSGGEGESAATNSATYSKAEKVFPDGTRYAGEMQKGHPHGLGILHWPDGARYEGAFYQGERTGRGIFTWPSGNRYEGAFVKGKRHGAGTFVWANGARYTGHYRMGKKNGTGIFQDANKTVEVCYNVPERHAQQWDDGQLTQENTMPLDELMPDLAYEAQMHPPQSPWGSRLSRRLSTLPALTKDVVSEHAPIKPRFWHHSQTGMKFAFVSSGCFSMGSSLGSENEKPKHPVCLDGFWMGVHEVTQGVWQQVMKTLPEQSKRGKTLPVENISWNEVMTFIERLNRVGSPKFRLPSEAEWEFACRSGGQNETYCGGEMVDSLAWHQQNSDNQVHPVGKQQANRLGLFDMSGNLWEWVADWYDAGYYQRSPQDNPKGPVTGQSKVLRGGAWMSAPKFLRSTLRYDLAPDRGFHLLGVRLVVVPPETTRTTENRRGK